MEPFDSLNHRPRAENQRRSRMWRSGAQVENSRASARSASAGLFHDISDGSSLAEETRAAALVAKPLFGGIKQNAAAHEDVKRIRDKRTGPARVDARFAVAVPAVEVIIGRRRTWTSSGC